jgi:hypothetical protein
MMLIVRAYALLLSFEQPLARHAFAGLYRRVRDRAVRARRANLSCQDACRAVNLACVFYFKEVQCLQRSAALACLLRDLGISATLVLGAQRLPFKAHAWVEVRGCVINDSPSCAQLYGVLDRL